MFGKKHQRGSKIVSPRQANHLAARMGHWSATHWKTAVIAWLVFVAGAMYFGNQVGVVQINQNDANVGESRTADRIINNAGFTIDAKGESTTAQGEMVLVQSKTLTAADPAFRAAVADVQRTLRQYPKVHNLRAPPLDGPHTGQISKDGHAVLIQYTPVGTYEEASKYIDTLGAAVEKVDTRHAGVTMESVGLSTDKAFDAEIQGGLGKVGLISITLTIIILMIVLGSLVAALIPLLVGITSVIATFGLIAFASQGIAASKDINEVILLVGLAVGVDYSLFYMRREREERAAGRGESAALAAAAVHADRRELEREVLRQGRHRGGERRDEREARRRAAATRTAHEEQCPSRANLAGGVPSDLQRQQEMRVDVAASLLDVELRKRRVVGTGARDQHVVNRRVQLVEEPLEPVEVGGVEGGDAGPELEADALQAVRVARRDDHVGSLLAHTPGRLEPDAGAAPDHDERLAGELRFATHDVVIAPAICACSARSASTKISENVGNGWIVSRSTSSGTPARTASVACCSHSPASGPSA
jgi:hypothetical protein